MNDLKNIVVYGSSSACELARLALENHKKVRRVDVSPDGSRIRVFLSDRMPEGELIELFQKSGISGFEICR